MATTIINAAANSCQWVMPYGMLCLIRLINSKQILKQEGELLDTPASILIERFGIDFEQYGSTRSLGRVFAALLIAEEPQTLSDLASTLQVSKATISLTLRQALQAELVDKISKPGDRRDYYVVPDDIWIRTTLSQLRLLTRWKALAAHGIEDLPKTSARAHMRLTKMIEFFDMVESRFADWELEWDRSRD